MIYRVLLALVTVVLCAPTAEARALCAAREGWHASVHSHRDLGFARVAWTWSWNAEGVADDFHVVDCAAGQGLSVRARAERMSLSLPYDRRATAEALINRAAKAPHFFSLATLAKSLTKAHLAAETFVAANEPCACAAFYPGVYPHHPRVAEATGQNNMSVIAGKETAGIAAPNSDAGHLFGTPDAGVRSGQRDMRDP